MPWPSVWPGALFFSDRSGIANYVFPFYLPNVSDLTRIGGTIGFVLVALLWFYAISLGLLAGAVINSLRHERDDTGRPADRGLGRLVGHHVGRAAVTVLAVLLQHLLRREGGHVIALGRPRSGHSPVPGDV